MEKKKPVYEVKLGTVKATVWDNGGQDQGAHYSIQVARLYKSENVWKETSSLRRDDVPVAAKALDMCYGWIWRKQAIRKTARGVMEQSFAAARR